MWKFSYKDAGAKRRDAPWPQLFDSPALFSGRRITVDM